MLKRASRPSRLASVRHVCSTIIYPGDEGLVKEKGNEKKCPREGDSMLPPLDVVVVHSDNKLTGLQLSSVLFLYSVSYPEYS